MGKRLLIALRSEPWARFHWKRLYFAGKTRTAPWRVPSEVAIIGVRRPPEYVFDYFRKLHGIAPDSAGERQAK